MKNVRLSVLVALVLLFSACSIKPTWDLAGKWKTEDGKQTIEFMRNGTLTLQNEETALTTAYKRKDPKHLQIDLGPLGMFVIKFAVSNNTLTLTDANGTVCQLQRAR